MTRINKIVQTDAYYRMAHIWVLYGGKVPMSKTDFERSLSFKWIINKNIKIRRNHVTLKSFHARMTDAQPKYKLTRYI